MESSTLYNIMCVCVCVYSMHYGKLFYYLLQYDVFREDLILNCTFHSALYVT